MRRLPLLLIAACALLLAATSVAGAAQKRVVNGDDAGDGEYPWTVALVTAGEFAVSGQFCGGTLVAPDRVVTAAHCTVASKPEDIEVLANITDLRDAGTPSDPDGPNNDPNVESYYHKVSEISVHPKAEAAPEDDRLVYDLSVLSLEDPVPGAQWIPVISPGFDVTADLGDPLQVTGWGRWEQESPEFPNILQETDVFPWSDADCEEFYGSFAYAGGNLLCALRVGAGPTPDPEDDVVFDTCQGDSGGPITTQDATPDPLDEQDGWELAGAVSFGSDTCQVSDWPGAYASLRNADMNGYASDSDPEPQPVSTGGAPALKGQMVVGQTIACEVGTATFSAGAVPHAILQRVDGTDELTPVVKSVNAPATYKLQTGDIDERFLCEIRGVAPGAGGYGLAQSGVGARVVAAPVPKVETPAPVTPTAPPVVTPPPPPTTPVPIVPRDSSAPRITGLTRRCTRRRSCVITVSTADAAPSTGVRSVRVTLRSVTRRRCVKRGRRTTCPRTRTRTLRAVSTGNGGFRVVTGTLPKGRHTITLVASDAAGNRQLRASRLAFSLR